MCLVLVNRLGYFSPYIGHLTPPVVTMPELRNIRCTIHTAHGELAEFTDKNPDNTLGRGNAANTITRYLNISGTAGERFWVQFEVQPGFRWEQRMNCLTPDYMADGIKLKAWGSYWKQYPKMQYHGPRFVKKVNGKIAGFTRNMYFKELKVGMFIDITW